jgi:hypothetical protein
MRSFEVSRERFEEESEKEAKEMSECELMVLHENDADSRERFDVWEISIRIATTMLIRWMDLKTHARSSKPIVEHIAMRFMELVDVVGISVDWEGEEQSFNESDSYVHRVVEKTPRIGSLEARQVDMFMEKVHF